MGVAVVLSWRCLGDGRAPCTAGGEGDRSDLEARKHGDATSHGTTVTGRPTGGA